MEVFLLFFFIGQVSEQLLQLHPPPLEDFFIFLNIIKKANKKMNIVINISKS